MAERPRALQTRALQIRALTTGTLPAAARRARKTAGVFPPGAGPRGARRGIAVDLQPGDAQSGNAVPFDRALPGHEFLDRQIIPLADLGQIDGAAMDGFDDDRL